MARDRNQWPIEPMSHMLDKPGFPASRGAFQHHRYLVFGADGEQIDFPVHFLIERLFGDPELFNTEFKTLHELTQCNVKDGTVKQVNDLMSIIRVLNQGGQPVVEIEGFPLGDREHLGGLGNVVRDQLARMIGPFGFA